MSTMAARGLPPNAGPPPRRPRRPSYCGVRWPRAQPARALRIARLCERMRASGQWISADTVAGSCLPAPGKVGVAERRGLYEDACRSVFDELLAGTFVTAQLRPHIINEASASRLLPEHAQFIQGTWWDGERDYADCPVLPAGYLQRYLPRVWLPARLVRKWFEQHGLPVPDALAGRAPSRHKQASNGARQREPGITSGRPRGPRPTKREQIAAQMTADFASASNELDREKEESLANRYGVSRDTARRARKIAMDRLT
jgi:hypothetical protein